MMQGNAVECIKDYTPGITRKIVSPESRFNITVFHTSEEIIFRVESWLKNKKYSYFLTTDEEALLKEVLVFNTNVVVLEHSPPRMNCLRLLGILREEYKGSVIVVTSDRNTQHVMDNRFRDVDELIFMPVPRETFCNAIERFTSRTRSIASEKDKVKVGKDKLFLDKAEKICAEFWKSDLTMKEFGRKKNIKPMRLNNEMRIVRLDDDVKTMIREYPFVFAKKKSFFCEHLYKLATVDIIIIMKEVIEFEGNGQRYTIEMLKNRIREFDNMGNMNLG